MAAPPCHETLSSCLDAASFAVELFDRIPDVVYFVKDAQARYAAVNDTLVRRCGAASKNDLVGRTAAEVFPPPLGRRYLQQDHKVLTTGRATLDRFELHLYPGSEVVKGLDHGETLFYGLYYMMTGLHALHVIVGLILLSVVIVKIGKGKITKERYVLHENSGLYWHLVDFIWIFLFPLLYLIT